MKKAIFIKKLPWRYVVICNNGLAQLNPSNSGLLFSPEEQVVTAKIYQCLQVVSSNYSFSSTEADNNLYKIMFPGSRIAASYSQGKTKVRYNIQFRIDNCYYDVNNTPCTFKFDESTSSQIKKQYDGYLQYWSAKYDDVINCYCRSLFVGHCTHEQLIEHYYEFTKNLKLDSSFLLHLGIDGPSVNNAFQQKLFDGLHEKEGTSFLNMETCWLHKVHNAYQTALKELKFDSDQFAVDIDSFFKLSSARREDYIRMEEV